MRERLCKREDCVRERIVRVCEKREREGEKDIGHARKNNRVRDSKQQGVNSKLHFKILSCEQQTKNIL